MANVKLTHKLRNPKSYNEGMDIGTATVHDPESQGASPKYEIKPSDNGKISSDVLNDIPVDKIKSVNFTETIGETEKNYTTTNVTIKSEPTDNTLGLNGNSIAITNANGSIREGAQIDSNNGNSNKFLNEKGNFTLLPNYTLSVTTKPNGLEAPSTYLLFQKDNNTESEIGINGIYPLYSKTNADGDITIQIADQSIGRDQIATNAITADKIYGGSPASSTNSMSSNLKTTIGLNSLINDGIVPATENASAAGKIGSADTEGNPAGNDFSSTQGDKAADESLTAGKLDTRLLGAGISEDSVSKDGMIENSENNNYWSYQDSVTYIIGSDNHEYTFDGNINVSLSNNKIIYNYNMPQGDNLSTEIDLNKDSYKNVLSAYDLGILLKNFMDTRVQNSRNQPYSTFTMGTVQFKDIANNIVIDNFNSNVDSEKVYPINFYRFSDGDGKHLGIWIQI